MKIKYAIYKNEIGLRAVEYVDSKKAIKNFPYIKEDSLPVIINCVGGYTSFNLEYEKEHGFIKIVEIDENKEPLTLEQRYPKNSNKFEYGWISTDGDTYNTGYEGHLHAADAICDKLGYNSYHGERELEDRGWIKITGNWNNGIFKKLVFVKDLRITKKQADTLFDINLLEVSYVPSMIKISEYDW